MSYTKTNWINDTTPLNAENMNHIENGIYNNDVAIQGKESTSNKVDSISDESTNTEYPSAKAVKDVLPVGYTDQEVHEMCEDVLYPALPVPTNIELNGAVLSFDSVDEAEWYNIYADGNVMGNLIPVEEIELLPSDLSYEMKTGDTKFFNVSVLPSNVKDKRVTWSIEGAGTIQYSDYYSCQIQAGDNPGTIILTATSFSTPAVSGSAEIQVKSDPVTLLDIDYSDGTIGSPYNNAHWLQEKYNNGWQTVTGQMNCRADPSDPSNKVVNMVTGYFMNYRYTYTPDTMLEGATKLTADFGNYFSGAQPLSVKISVYDENNNQIYIAGDANNYVTIPVGSTLEPYEYTFNSTNVSKIQFLVKNSTNSNAYLYTDNIKVIRE